MLLATALALLITGCAQQTFTVQNKPAAENGRNHHLITFVSELGRRKTVDAAKICGAENVVKQKLSKISVNGLLGFITLGIYIAWKRVCVLLTIIA